jgi:hypothetical protein
MSAVKKIAFFLVALFLTVFFLESILWTFSLIFPKVNLILSKSYTGAAIPDTVLGNRPNPSYVDHDKKGFRNKSIPKNMYIVCLRDSQTYGIGVGVTVDQAWSQQLSNMKKFSTYTTPL